MLHQAENSARQPIKAAAIQFYMASFANVVHNFCLHSVLRRAPSTSGRIFRSSTGAPTIVGMMGASEGSGESPRRPRAHKEDGKRRHAWLARLHIETCASLRVLDQGRQPGTHDDEGASGRGGRGVRRLLQLPTWDEILPSVKVFDPEKWPVTGNRRNERVNDSTSYDLRTMSRSSGQQRRLQVPDAATDFNRTMSPLNDDGEPSYVYKSLLAAAKEALGGDEQKEPVCYEGPRLRPKRTVDFPTKDDLEVPTVPLGTAKLSDIRAALRSRTCETRTLSRSSHASRSIRVPNGAPRR